jgi:hypothetical protein
MRTWLPRRKSYIQTHLQLLNDAVQNGGTPIGLIRVSESSDDKFTQILQLQMRVFPEHENAKEDAEDYMRRFVQSFADSLRNQYPEAMFGLILRLGLP